MKRFVAMLIIFSILAISASAECNVNFNGVTNTLLITGEMGVKSPVVVTISDSSAQPSKDNPPVYMYIYETGVDSSASFTVKLSPDIASGKYYYYVDGEIVSEKGSFLIVNKDDNNTINVIEDIKSILSAQELYDILSDGNKANVVGVEQNERLDEVCNIMYAEIIRKGKDTLTAEIFSDVYGASLCADKIIAGENVSTVVNNYATYFGTTAEAYNETESDVKEKFEEIIKTADFFSNSLKDIYTEKMLISKIVCASGGELKDLLHSNASYIGIDVSSTSSYNKIKEVNRFDVFSDMMSNFSDNMSISDLKSVFNSAVSKVLSKQNASSSNSSSVGGGGFSGPSISVNKTTGNDKNDGTSVPNVPILSKFDDIDEHFAKDSIEKLYSMGIVSGYDENTFKPDNFVTRAEFSKMICLAFGIDENFDKAFEDVSASDWYYSYVGMMNVAGIIQGDGINFYPNDNLTREDAAVIISRVISEKLGESSKSLYSDYNEVSNYAMNAVDKLTHAGIMSGFEGYFRPKASITRGEASVLIVNALNVRK